MKRVFYYTYILFIAGIFLNSCNTEDYLDTKPLGEYSDADVWSDPALAETFVNSVYLDAMGYPFAVKNWSSFVDETYLTHNWGLQDVNKSLITQDNLSGLGFLNFDQRTGFWDNAYKSVRKTNMFFAKVNQLESSSIDNEWINRLKGEAYFLRAYMYFKLINYYGGIPLITKPYNLNDEFELPRNSYKDCIDFIVGQLDSASMYLPISQSDMGRATKGAALAVKSRVLLYAASDLHHDMNIYAPGFSNPELLGFTNGDQQSRWLLAKAAAKEVIDLDIYNLVNSNPAQGDSIAKLIADYFLTQNMTEEDILLQPFNSKSEGYFIYRPGMFNGPNGYNLWGSNTPLGELVDDYEMRDGNDFDWDNPIHAAHPYKNRDQRFYATILYEGAEWSERPTGTSAYDPFGKMQMGTVFNTQGEVLVYGLDTRNGPVSDWNGSYTGYNERKFLDPALNPEYIVQEIPFRHIRYAEVLLNYAEACAELGEYMEARIYLNMIRKRAGQPEVNLSGAELIQKIRHERRIELALENHRFWDVRRWLIGNEAYQQTHGVDIKYVTSENATLYLKEDGSTWGDPIITKINNRAGDARAWNNKFYFFPIMRDEMNKNTMLVQNPGY